MTKQQTQGASLPKWKYNVEMIAACNCDWGCPCNFNAKPTYGFCEGVYGGRIRTGTFENLRLDGLKFAWAGKWPRAIHEGGGTAKIWIDETSSGDQRNALDSILKGRHGGSPWGIFAPTIDNWVETSFVPFEWSFDGHRSHYKAGTEVQAHLDPIRNPVTGDEASAKIMLPKGIVVKELEAASTKSFAVFTKGLKFAAPGQWGFYAIAEHSN